MFKRVLIAISTVLYITLGVAMPLRVHAVVDPTKAVCQADRDAQNSEFCKNVRQENNRSILYGRKSLMGNILQTVIYLTGAIAVILIIIGGIRYVLSAGDSNAVQGAKNTVMYAAIGLAVAIFAQTIVSFVLTKFLTI